MKWQQLRIKLKQRRNVILKIIWLHHRESDICPYFLQDRTAENERKVRWKIGGIHKHVGGKAADGVPF